MRKHLPLFSGTSLLIPIALLLFSLVSCGRNDSSQRHRQSSPKPKAFPSAQYDKARNLMDQGNVLYSQATNADSQEEKNRLSREAMDAYYRPAQGILDTLLRDYPEHSYDIESLYQELNRRISAATRMDGTGD